MRKVNGTATSTRKQSVRHSWFKVRPGVRKCTVCGITQESKGGNVIEVRLTSGELYSTSGKTPECKDLSEFY